MKSIYCLVIGLCLIGNAFGQGKGATQNQVEAAKAVMVAQYADMVSSLLNYYSCHGEAAMAAANIRGEISRMCTANPGWDGSMYEAIATNYMSSISTDYDCFNSYIMIKSSLYDNTFSVIADSYILHCYYNVLAPDSCNWDSLVSEFNIVNGQSSDEPMKRTSICTNAAVSASKMSVQTGLLNDFSSHMIDQELEVRNNLEAAQNSLYNYLHP